MLARFFAAPQNLNVWQWAERNIVLDRKMSPGNPGPYRSSFAPHTRFIQEQFSRPEIRQITIKKNSQGAYTEAVLNCIRYCVANEPRNVLYVIDSASEARRISRIRLLPTLRSCGATDSEFTEDAGDDTTMTIVLRDMFIMFAGGGSIGAVANKPIELGVVDEADKIPRITGGHGHVVHEMKARFKTVPSMKLFVLSAPNEEEDVTTQEYKNGTQHKYFLPCPHCGHFQEMVQERLTFEHCKNAGGEHDKARVINETHYLCERAGTPECPDGRIYDHHKPAMTERGQWRATNDNAEPGHISLESSDLFSLFPDATLGRIALDLIESFKNPLKKRSVQRDRFGLEYRPRRAEIKKDDLLLLKGSYKRGTMPVECAYLAMASDYQGTGPKWVKGGFARNNDLYIVDWGDDLGLDDLVKHADEPVIETSSGRQLIVIGGLVDEGHKQSEVLSFCVRASNGEEFRFLSAKGRGNLQNAGALVVESERTHDGARFQAYHFNDDKFKADLYISRIKDFQRIKRGISRVPRLWFPLDVDGEFLDELTGEQLTPILNEWGQTRLKWKVVAPNHWGDATKMLLVLWQVVGAEALAAMPPLPTVAPAAPAG